MQDVLVKVSKDRILTNESTRKRVTQIIYWEKPKLDFILDINTT